MRHKKALGKLNRDPSHRYGMLRNLATSLVIHGTIETTIARAKELKRVADKLITLGKKDTLHARRQAMAFLRPINKNKTGNAHKWTAVHKLFTELAPMYSERNGGYTRVLRTNKRDGDNAQMAIIQFVEAEVQKKETKRKKRKVSRTEQKPAEDTKKTEAKKEAEVTKEAKPIESSETKEASAKAEDAGKDPSKEAVKAGKSEETTKSE